MFLPFCCFARIFTQPVNSSGQKLYLPRPTVSHFLFCKIMSTFPEWLIIEQGKRRKPEVQAPVNSIYRRISAAVLLKIYSVNQFPRATEVAGPRTTLGGLPQGFEEEEIPRVLASEHSTEWRLSTPKCQWGPDVVARLYFRDARVGSRDQFGLPGKLGG